MSHFPLRMRARSAGRTGTLFSALVLATTYSLTQVRGAPASTYHILYAHHHPRSAVISSAPKESDKRESEPSVFSPKNSFFPVIIVALISLGLTALGLLVFFLHQTRRKSADKGTCDEADSTMEKFGHIHPIDLSKPAKVHPVMSSVSRGTPMRFSPNFDSTKYAFLDMNDESFVHCGGSEKAHSLIHDSDSAFSIDIKDSSDGHSLRQSDLCRPCVTHGPPGWNIQAYEESHDEVPATSRPDAS